VHQTLGNTTPFTLLPHPYTRGCGKGLAVQQERRLPCWSGSGGGRHIHPSLSCWFPDDNISRWPGGSPCGHISRAGGGLFCRAWSLPSSTGRRRRRGSLIVVLGWLLLRNWPSTGHKTANCHCPSCLHVVTSIRFSFWRADWFDGRFLGYLDESFRFSRGLGLYKDLRLNGGFRLNPHVSLLLAS